MAEKFLYEKKIKNNTELNIWMGFPSNKAFALSSLGYMYIYKTLDLMDNVKFEPVYIDTLKTEIMVQNLDLFGFSFSFDMDFLNILRILDQHNISLKSSLRKETDPIIFGGGPVLTANPEPYHEIFDFIIIGDGENILKTIVDTYSKYKNESRSVLLKNLSLIEGIYVPSLNPKNIKKLTCTDLNVITTPILSDESFFKNTFIIEIERGCFNRCGFCVASYINLPIRFLDYDEIIKNINFGLKHTNKIALLGAMIAKHPRFNDICEYIYKKIEHGENIELSFSSLRADNITDIAIKALAAGGQKTSTIAIEAGSERLRKVINKNLTEKQITDCITICQRNGLKGLKIYAMIGLPTETEEDIEAFVILAKKFKSMFKNFNISYSFSTFIPKAQTPFQWCKREDLKILKNKQNYLKKEFHKLGIKADFSSAKWDYYQAILSTGSRKLSDAIYNIYQNGGTSSAFKKFLPAYEKQFNFEDNLPWDFIKTNTEKEFLKSEYKKLLKL